MEVYRYKDCDICEGGKNVAICYNMEECMGHQRMMKEIMITSMFKWINGYFEMLIDEGVII